MTTPGPRSPLDPCHLSEQAMGWALHALEPHEEHEVIEHLPGCGRCRRTVRETEETMALMGASVEQVDPPASLRSSLMAQVAATPQERPPTRVVAAPAAAPLEAAPPTPERPRRQLSRTARRLIAGKLALAAALTIGVLGVRGAQLGDERDAEAARASALSGLVDQLGRSPYALLTGTDGATLAAVVDSSFGPQVYPVAMAANAADQTYVLWGLSANAGPEAIGTFDVRPSSVGAVSVVSGTEAGSFPQYAISIEPGRVAPALPTQVVASGQVEI